MKIVKNKKGTKYFAKFHLVNVFCVMKILIWAIGKTDEKYLEQGIEKYLKRLKHYCKFEYETFKDVKSNSNMEDILKRESELILSRLKSDDFLVLLDEYGSQYTSVSFSEYLEKLQLQSLKSVVFLIGGAYGHHPDIKARANHMISLSKMTFSHQMVRLFLVEQLYRGFTILKNEKYHNI